MEKEGVNNSSAAQNLSDEKQQNKDTESNNHKEINYSEHPENSSLDKNNQNRAEVNTNNNTKTITIDPVNLPLLESDGSFKFYVGAIEPNVWEADLLNHFSQYGPVKEIDLKKDPITNMHRPYGFITMATKESREPIFTSVHVIGGKMVEIRCTHTQNLNRKIFVGGLNNSNSEAELKEYFSQYGVVDLVNIMRDAEGKCRGFGFIIFEDQAIANSILEKSKYEINGKLMDVRPAEVRHKSANKGYQNYRAPINQQMMGLAATSDVTAMYNNYYSQWYGRNMTGAAQTVSPYCYANGYYLNGVVPQYQMNMSAQNYSPYTAATAYDYSATAAATPAVAATPTATYGAEITPKSKGTNRTGPY